MIANQTSRGFRSAARWFGLLGSSVALVAACGGTIEQTEVDQQHLENGSTGKQLSKTAEASSTPAKPAATNQTAATPAATTPKPAATPPPADEEDPPADDEDPPASTASGDVSFASDVWPIFNKGCAPCHTSANYGNQNVGAADKDAAFADAKRIETKLISDLSTGRMPPGCSKPPGGGGSCVSADDFDKIQSWVEGGTAP